jgi:hypothetical protein
MRDRLTLLDFSDREFLLIVHESADGDGWTDSESVRLALDLKERRNASSRLAWLARWGAVEREEARDDHGTIRTRRNGKIVYTQRWRLTDAGHALAFGSLRAKQQQSLDRIDDTQLLEVTRWLSQRTRNGGITTKLALREWKHVHQIR